MSINSLTNAALARRPDMVPLRRVPLNQKEIAAAADNVAGAQTPGATETTLNVLAGYIPAEILTLYVTTYALLDHTDTTWRPELIAFAVYFFATPVVVWLVFAAKLRARGKPLPLAPRTWPVWETVAATIAFAAWALALPEAPFVEESWYSYALAGGGALIVSIMLGLIAGVMQNPLDTGEPEAPT